MNIIGIYNAPACVTMLGLIASVFACTLAINGNHEFALTALIWAGIFDLFDGMVARRTTRTETESRFGVQIDSIVDVISFGITPAIILTTMHHNIWSLIIAVFYVCAAAQRLAYFNVLQESVVKENSTTKSYLGLPVTFAALIFGVGLFPVVTLSQTAATHYANGLMLLTGILFITPFTMKKPGGIVYLMMPVLALAATVFWLWQGLTGGFHVV
ncbi:CDP-alcohol phosphatidyltransferase family protein [Vibrio quintilis]|uniref:CDP-alcohol phosphatidyltransferase n=1 Tax=Vibrio quintilis TaxID=1117707 RepID=A0A1M7YY93_9VIBR|nr:CDP-alcohol phosphatidyltransferase family protein [Vibrio quintilis]SHO57532.1 CDP-alcohol phosphatidyltransferase [Vibrio quintilis]